MNIALLFNWRAYDDASNYWWATRELVFASGIIQRSGRHMKMSVGDVLVGHERGLDPDLVYKAAVLSSEWRRVHEDRLTKAFLPPTLFAMVFENMPRALAAELHEVLTLSPGYLGAVSVHFEFGPHLALYRASLPPEYRLQGAFLRSFYSMGSEEGCDEHDLKEMRRFGYTDVGFEDRGASRTILDDFDTPRHFQRVAAFRDLLTAALPGGEDDAYELAMMLEDLSPKLFNALGAAAERLADVETEEDVAQVALSGRRYMEQLADALFPPQEVSRGNRSLNRAAYRNRLWAFIEDNTRNDVERLKSLGAEVDRVVEELNGGLHADRAKERVAQGIADAATLTAELLALNPEAARNPYLAYSESIFAFARRAFSREGSGDKGDD
ncbi:hypothetical protein [Phenylobacterium sp.]|uniref:hypothetical protein n=1 Tax=Phenylobacterium sp. TaxID=1871053 RepID=UPI002FC6E5AD